MERYEDIQELLKTVQSNINQIELEYKKAKQDDELKTILRPLVKSTLEHLRSILEYATQDIWLSYNSKSNKKLYFPYGKDRHFFNKSINKNLPRIKKIKPNIYNLISNLQPHKCQDNWLIELCKQTNFNKHDKLSLQKRKNSKNSRTTIGNMFQIDATSSITFSNCSINGVPVGSETPVHIHGEMDTKTIKDKINLPINISKEFDWVEFRFENSAIDTLQLIKKSYQEISNFITKLKNEID